MKSEITEFGFDFGSMEVTRVCSDDKGVAVISVKTPKVDIKIRATKTGQVRFFIGEQECELVDKEISRSGLIEVKMIKKR